MYLLLNRELNGDSKTLETQKNGTLIGGAWLGVDFEVESNLDVSALVTSQLEFFSLLYTVLPGYLKVHLAQAYHLVLSKISSVARNPISYCTSLPNQVPSELIMCFIIFAVYPACENLAVFMAFSLVLQLKFRAFIWTPGY